MGKKKKKKKNKKMKKRMRKEVKWNRKNFKCGENGKCRVIDGKGYEKEYGDAHKSTGWVPCTSSSCPHQ